MNDGYRDSVTRRTAMASGALGLATVGTTLAAQPGSAPAGAAAIDDPLEKYPKPPFERQSQPWPGLASKMHPKPDHGEQSYRGSGRLIGRKALITGGDSGMGRAAAIAFAREGADVAISYYPTEEPDAAEVLALIRGAGRTGAGLPGDLRDEHYCTALVSKAVAAQICPGV